MLEPLFTMIPQEHGCDLWPCGQVRQAPAFTIPSKGREVLAIPLQSFCIELLAFHFRSQFSAKSFRKYLLNFLFLKLLLCHKFCSRSLLALQFSSDERCLLAVANAGQNSAT